MPYRIEAVERGIVLELDGGVTARDVAALARDLCHCVQSGSTVLVRTGRLEDVDTSVLQMLVSLGKTAAEMRVEDASEAFRNAAERCALGRELLGRTRAES